MGPAIELPLADCRACGEALRGCWEFAPDDLHCGLCGRQVFELAFGEDVTRRESPDEPEVWLYAAEGADLVVNVWGLHGVPESSRPRVAVSPEFGQRAGTARFASSEFGTRDFAVVFAARTLSPPVTLADPAPCPDPPWMIPGSAAVRLKLVPEGDPVPLTRIPPDGVPGRIVLDGPHGAVRSARLFRLVATPLEFAPPVSTPPPELTGYYDEYNVATVRLAVTARAHVVARIVSIKNQEELRGIRPTTLRGLGRFRELPYDQQLQLAFRFETGSNPDTRQPLTINWELAGFAQPILYNCILTLRPRPRLTISPNGELPQEVVLGGRPVECALILVPSGGKGDTVPEIQQQLELVLDPPAGEWLRAEPFPAIPHRLTGRYLVRMTIDTARLDRAAMDGQVLTAAIRFVDQAGHVWEHAIEVRAVRLRPDDGVLAIDWGTTNTCAAHSDSAETSPRPLALPPPLWREIPLDYEQFPSVLYIEDLSDPGQPVFHLGPIARTLANRRGPECLIHSLKRRFFAGGLVYVRDEARRKHAYTVEQLTRLVLVRLVELAEHELGREVRHLGFTFPTKWPAAVRRRFARVLREVAADLAAARPHAQVAVRLVSPDIDEANAVALNVLQQLRLDDKLSSDRTFTLVAYDFGGGTIDTSVLQVRLDSSADLPLTTRYLGIGGTGDFGGDEVTRATAELLRDRVNGVIQEKGYELPFRRPGDPPDPVVAGTSRAATDLQRDDDALRNWELIWTIAEDLKKLLCKPAGEASTEDPVSTTIGAKLVQLACHPVGADGGEERQSLEDLVGALFPTDRDPFFDAVRFGLDEVYNYKRGSGATALTVEERIRDTFLEIKAQLAAAGNLTADVIVLAGGGCRLPLVTQLVREYLGPPPAEVAWDAPDRLIYDARFAKQRVAHGKATYLIIARDNDDLARGLARSVEVLHRPLVVTRAEVMGMSQEVVVQVGELMHNPDRPHAFRFTRKHVRNEKDRRVLSLSVMSWQGGRRVTTRLGYFDLDAGTPTVPLPKMDKSVEVEGELSLTRPPVADPDAEPVIGLVLTVRWPGEPGVYGPFLFVPLVPPGELATRLQGEVG